MVVDRVSGGGDNEDPPHRVTSEKLHMVELTRSKGPPEIGSIEEAMNMEVESLVMYNWFHTCFQENNKIMEEIS